MGFGGYMIRPPPYLINIWGIPTLTLFWTENTAVTPVPVRDIYALEFQLFQSTMWSAFYILSVFVFMVHAMLGWKKVTPVLGIPTGHVKSRNIWILDLLHSWLHLHVLPCVVYANSARCWRAVRYQSWSHRLSGLESVGDAMSSASSCSCPFELSGFALSSLVRLRF